MKAPMGWLKEFVEIDCATEELAERLTFSGLEVEGIALDGSDYRGIVAAEVLSVNPHPRADNLFVCGVHDGMNESQVVSGARNCGVGAKVPFAGVGAILPDGRKVGRRDFLGITSEGMLCAEDELGLSDDHSGLMLLARNVPCGEPLAEVLGPPEQVLNIEVTSNRADCLSIIGIAREIAALFGRRLRLPSVRLDETGESIEESAEVSVEDAGACPRYTARLVSGIKPATGPLWMRRRLAQCGVRPINNVVDITNYVMMECGQPLHAFDLDLLDKGRITVRMARERERILTLEGTERSLAPDMLVIADSRGPVALAGIMGGASSAISGSTRSVLLESACFKASVIRRTSKTLGVASESSRRFEHGVDIGNVDWAGRRAAALLADLAGGRAAKGVIDAFPVKPEQRRIACRFDRARKLLGVGISGARMVDIFKSLGLKVTESDRKSCLVHAPSFRPDLEREADLIEEVARLHGLENIPARAPRCSIDPGADDAPVRAAMLCKSRLCGLGLSEIMNYSFVAEDLLNAFERDNDGRRVVLPRPVSAEQSMLRDSLIPQMCDTLRRNCSRQIERAALFEMGRVFFKSEEGRLVEEERLAIGIMGPVGQTGLDRRSIPDGEEVFLWLKGIVEGLCRAMGFRDQSREPAGGEPRITFSLLHNDDAFARKSFPASCLDKDRSVSVLLDDAPVGILGLLKQSIRGEWRMRAPTAVFEAKTEPLLGEAFAVLRTKPLPVYPSVSRDMAIVVRKDVKHENVLAAIRKIAPKELTGVEIFDIYYGKELGDVRKGMAYSLRYSSRDRTLRDDEVNELHAAIKAGIRKMLEAEIREG